MDLSNGHIGYADGRAVFTPRMPLWLVRHGETHINLRRDAEGWAFSGTDDEQNQLTGRGRQQAQELASRLWNTLGADVLDRKRIIVITSALPRAKDTATPFIAMLESRGVDSVVRIEPRFNEIDLGAWNNRLFSELPAESERMKRWRFHADAVLCPADGECFLQMMVRTKEALEDCTREFASEIVVVFSHATAISAIRMNTGDPEFEDANGVLRWTGKGLKHAEFMRLGPG
ncbi:MAG: histidine phosphatase family protein [Pseudomonadota bacterium]